MKRYNVAVVGVGAVGEEMLRVLRQRQFPIDELRVFARSSREFIVDNRKYSVQKISPDGFGGIDIALFAGTEGEKGAAVTYAPEAVKRGAIVIDNGADFRLQKGVPLVVPEVNPEDVKKHKGIIANPNCSTIQLVVAIAPIFKKVGIKRMIVVTYQAASGAGRAAVEQLWAETQEIMHRSQKSEVRSQKNLSSVICHLSSKVLPQQIAFNVFPQIGSFQEAGYTTEEWKTVKETHKILHDENIKISSTTARVPVAIGHSQAVYLETAKKITVASARELLKKAKGVKVIDEVRISLDLSRARKYEEERLEDEFDGLESQDEQE